MTSPQVTDSMDSTSPHPHRANTLKTLEEYERLSENTMYRRDYLPSNLNKQISRIVRKIDLGIGRGRGGTYSASLRYIVSNLLLATQKGYSGFRINVSNNNYDSEALLGRKGFRTVVDTLAEQGYLEIIPGRSFQGSSRSGYESEDVLNFSTILIFTDKFLAKIDDELDSYTIPTHFVQISDRTTDAAIKADTNNPDFKRVHNILSKMNSITGEGRVTYHGITQRSMDYTAMYKAQQEPAGTKITGGRIYAKHKFQCFPSDTRLEKIRIDDCECTELDFSSMHINLILEQLQAKGADVEKYRGVDPYTLDDLTLDEYDRFEMECWGIDKARQRKVTKTVVNALINCKDHEQSLKAVSSILIQNRLLYKPHRVQELKDAILRRSPFLEPYMCTDAGLDLQFIDAKIALEVISMFNEMNEVCLPYHDSFVVRRDLESKLVEAMRMAWLKIMGDDKFCAVASK